MGTPYAVCVALLIALGALAAAVGDDQEAGPADLSASVEVVAHRVERLRGLRFERIPVPVRVSPAQAARDALEDFDRHYPLAERESDQEVLEMLGLMPEDVDLRELNETIAGEQVAGYYDPRDGRLRVVATGTAGGALEETTLAHELVHALEDQVFGIDVETTEESGDAGDAYLALVEGTATAVMEEYMKRHVNAGAALGELLASLPALGSLSKLPPFVIESLFFSYEAGAGFVEELRRIGRGSWKLVDVALRVRPPASTEQILHPEKWISAEPPLQISVPSPGKGWEKVTDGVIGEWMTGYLLGDEGAAAGWGGDRYALFARGTQRRLVVRWAWDTPRDALEFAEFLRRRFPAQTITAGRLRTTLVLAGPQ